MGEGCSFAQDSQGWSHRKTLEHRPEGQEGMSQKQTWEKRVLGRQDSKRQGPELETHLMSFKNSHIKKNNVFNYL